MLGKVSRLQIHRPARPGDTLRYDVKIENVGPEGAMLSGTSSIGDHVQAEAEFFLAILSDRRGEELFNRPNSCGCCACWAFFEVGKTADGQPLAVPDFFIQAESTSAEQ